MELKLEALEAALKIDYHGSVETLLNNASMIESWLRGEAVKK